MDRVDVQKLLMSIQMAFPNFKVIDKTQTVDTWLMLLEEYSFNDVMLAFKAYCKSDNSGFAPSVSQLISQTEKPRDLAQMDELTAWGIVRTAIGRSAYNSVEEFSKLPPTLQKAVGSAEVLRAWAIDENYNEGVVMSAFRSNYKQVCQRQREFERLPVEMQTRVEQFIEKAPRLEDGALLIGSAEKVEPKQVNPLPLGEYSKRVEGLINENSENSD